MRAADAGFGAGDCVDRWARPFVLATVARTAAAAKKAQVALVIGQSLHLKQALRYAPETSYNERQTG